MKPSLTFPRWPRGHAREAAHVCVHTVCVYVWINGCFAPLIMPRHHLRPEGMRGRGSCDWLTCYAILSDSESPFTAIAYRCPEGGTAHKDTCTCREKGMCLEVRGTLQYIFIYILFLELFFQTRMARRGNGSTGY